MRLAGRGVSDVTRIEVPLSSTHWLRSFAAFAVMAVAVMIWSEGADARLEREASLSGASARNIMASPVAAAAPVRMAALDHVSPGQQSGSLGGLFSRPGLLGGFAAGFLGAGLLGLLFGHGLFGGLNGVASFLGLIFQLALVVLLCRLIWTWWYGRNLPAFSGLSPRQLADPYLRSRHEWFPGNGASPNADSAAADKDAAASVERR
jgi:hypothetical protein